MGKNNYAILPIPASKRRLPYKRTLSPSTAHSAGSRPIHHNGGVADGKLAPRGGEGGGGRPDQGTMT